MVRGPDGAIRAYPLTCTSRICPLCARFRANRAYRHWSAVHEAAASDGAGLYHVTLTQRTAKPAPPGLVTPHEWARGWRGTLATPTTVARTTEGEGLGTAYRRFMDAFRDVRQDRSSRELWDGVGILRGIEYTGRDGPCRKTGPRARKDCQLGVCGHTNHPRWHVHGHFLLTVPAPLRRHLDRIVTAWCRRSGALPSGQLWEECAPEKVREVLKYPFKPASLTMAQRIETLAYARGSKPHHAAGAWDPRAKARRTDDRWNRWLAARPVPESYQRLHLIPYDNTRESYGEPELYRGQVTEGVHRWTWDPRTDETFTADARPFAAAAQRPIGDYPEPGAVSGLGDDRFEREPGDDSDDPADLWC